MFFALRGLPVLLEIGLFVFCLIDAIQTPAQEHRNLAKGLWIVLIVLVPLVGGIAWLVAGRPQRVSAEHRTLDPEYERGRPAPLAPDDDPAFLAGLRPVDREHEQALGRWEADLRRREEELRRRTAEPPAEPPPWGTPPGS
jgi:hypothetical protein